MSGMVLPSAGVSNGPSLGAIISFVVHQDLKSSSLLVARAYDAYNAVGINKVNIQLSGTSPC